MSVVAGFVGTLVAIPAIMLIGDMATGIETGIFNSVSFGVSEWFKILLLPIVSSMLVAVTAYITVVKTLRSMI